MLHSVSSAAHLEALVEQSRREGFVPVSIDEAAVALKNANKSPFNVHNSHFSCFTFDDGYLDTYTLAYPALERLGVPFCVYMTRDFYRGTARPDWDVDSPMMNAKQLKAMSESPLCTIGAHTCTHPHLSTLPADKQRTEIADCKSDLENLLGKKVRHLAYPHGDYNKATIEIASELRFTTAVTTSGRHVRNDSRLLELDRVFA